MRFHSSLFGCGGSLHGRNNSLFGPALLPVRRAGKSPGNPPSLCPKWI